MLYPAVLGVHSQCVPALVRSPRSSAPHNARAPEDKLVKCAAARSAHASNKERVRRDRRGRRVCLANRLDAPRKGRAWRWPERSAAETKGVRVGARRLLPEPALRRAVLLLDDYCGGGQKRGRDLKGRDDARTSRPFIGGNEMIVTAVLPIIRAVVVGHTGRRSQIVRIPQTQDEEEEEEENCAHNAVPENRTSSRRLWPTTLGAGQRGHAGAVPPLDRIVTAALIAPLAARVRPAPPCLLFVRDGQADERARQGGKGQQEKGRDCFSHRRVAAAVAAAAAFECLRAVSRPSTRQSDEQFEQSSVKGTANRISLAVRGRRIRTNEALSMHRVRTLTRRQRRRIARLIGARTSEFDDSREKPPGGVLGERGNTHGLIVASLFSNDALSVSAAMIC
uniref:Uncharacterized protein n=1 Tax=Plectus sambesii TaxID=2011161 RepID=A0A914VV63_9BILA